MSIDRVETQSEKFKEMTGHMMKHRARRNHDDETKAKEAHIGW